MEERLNKAEVLEAIRSTHQEMEALLATLNEQQMLSPSLEQGWSVKDTLAHITSWERLMLGWLEAALRGETPVVYTPDYIEDGTNQTIDRLNEKLYEENKSLSLDEVLTSFRAAHPLSIKAVEAFSEEDLTEPNRFPWRNGRPLWWLVAGNTFGHYREHLEVMQRDQGITRDPALPSC